MRKWEELTIRRQHRNKNLGFTRKEHTGLDTETYKGYVKLICDSYQRYKDIDSFEDILNFLTFKEYRGKFNWFFNIKYDFDSIVKWLDLPLLRELYDNKTITYNTFKIFYIDKKFFRITDKHQHRYYFYDIAGFLETSLQNAAKKYLGKTKLEGVDGNLLNTSLPYWYANKEKIIAYCTQDAVLTKEVAIKFWDTMYETMQFNPKYPYSKGHFAEEYFLSKCYIPTINEISLDVLKYAFKSYSGGRFEILQKGFFPSVFAYDIKSAYPSVMAKLIDYNNGRWEYTKRFDDSAYDGFYLCNIQCKEKIISPFMQKVGMLNIYPNGFFQQYLSKSEIEFIRKHFKKSEIQIIDGYHFHIIEEKYPFKDEIERIYRLKEKETDVNLKYCYKIILNSFYGKTIQTAGGKTGKIFNPIWASNITGKTRLKLLEFALKNPTNVISFSTDSIHFTDRMQPIQNHPDRLGDFALDYKGKGWYIMSDIYYLEPHDTGKAKGRLRGFTIDFNKDISQDKQKVGTKNLKEILQHIRNEKEYKYLTKRPLHLGEVLKEPFIKSLSKKIHKEDINIFMQMMKRVNINGDMKRVWNREFTNGMDALQHNIQSKPILLTDDR